VTPANHPGARAGRGAGILEALAKHLHAGAEVSDATSGAAIAVSGAATAAVGAASASA